MREEESQPGVERACVGVEGVGGDGDVDVDADVGGCAGGWEALGLAFLAWASQASRVAWSTGHFSSGEGSCAIVEVWLWVWTLESNRGVEAGWL